jgi:hypothetical protein
VRRYRFEQGLGDTFRDLVLNDEDVFQLLVETPGPEVRAAGNGHQLRHDAQVVARLAHAAFEHGIGAKLPAYPPHVAGAFPVGK